MKRVCALAMIAFMVACNSNGADEPDEPSTGEVSAEETPVEEVPADEAEPRADDPETAEEQDPAALLGQRYIAEQVLRDGEAVSDDETIHVWFREEPHGPNVTIGIQACAGGTAAFVVTESTIEMHPDERGLADSLNGGCELTDIGTTVAQMFDEEIAWELNGEQLTLTQGDLTVELVETDPLPAVEPDNGSVSGKSGDTPETDDAAEVNDAG